MAEQSDKTNKVYVPQIESIGAIEHNGEIYLNAKDVAHMLHKLSKTSGFSSSSVRRFVHNFIINILS
jgi:prophage antirepressor-like protein